MFAINQVHAVVGVLSDDVDPMVTVMKLEKAPVETYADIGGLDTQIQEIKVSMLVYGHIVLLKDLHPFSIFCRNLLSCLSPIPSITKKWALNRPKASSCTVSQEQVS